MRILISCVLLLAAGVLANAQTVPFDASRWQITANESRVEEYLGRRALLLKGGQAIVKDSEFTDGIIEFDIAFSGERGFMGAGWRWQDAGNYEEFYMRPHQSGLPDANQYQPVFNGVAGWQLYHGPDYSTAIRYDMDKWMPVKIVVSGNSAEIYIKDLEKPLLFVGELKRKTMAGKVGLIAGNFAPAHFSNFRFTPQRNIKLIGQPKVREAEAPGTIFHWDISGPFAEKSLDGVFVLTDEHKKGLTWNKAAIEVGGFVNIARVYGIGNGKNTVFAKATISSEKDQMKTLKFGYSDIARVYILDLLIYSGTNAYQSRDYRYLGSIGLFDEVYLPLSKGDNEVWIAVSESSGGWGIMGMVGDMPGISLTR